MMDPTQEHGTMKSTSITFLNEWLYLSNLSPPPTNVLDLCPDGAHSIVHSSSLSHVSFFLRQLQQTCQARNTQSKKTVLLLLLVVILCHNPVPAVVSRPHIHTHHGSHLVKLLMF
jgi:hypothetical protein